MPEVCASPRAIALSRVKSATVHAIVTPGNAQASAKLPPMNAPLYDTARLHALADELIANIRELAVAGWTPATSSNFSQRLDDRHAAIDRKSTRLNSSHLDLSRMPSSA